MENKEKENIKALSGEEITPIQTSTTTNPNDIHMNQPENGGKAAERFTHYYNEMGDYTVVFDFNSDKEIPVGYFKAELNARLACVNLNSILESSLAAAKRENEELKDQIDKLREYADKLETCTDHTEYCEIMLYPSLDNIECTCGLNELLKTM